MLRRVAAPLSLLVLIAAAIAASPAHALPARGHEYKGLSFASPGSGAGQLRGPSGVAVSEATGEVYVSDTLNNRIEVFGPRGEFIAVWGFGVANGENKAEVCSSSCKAGIPGAGKGQLKGPTEIAVDNSTSPTDPSRGDVYVIADPTPEHAHVAKFSAGGEALGSLKQTGSEAKWEGALDGIAVDDSATVWVYRGLEAFAFIERFSDAVKNKYEEPTLEASVICPRAGFAVDPAGAGIYLDHERENRSGSCPSEEGEAPRPIVAGKLASSGEPLGTLIGALDPLQSTAIATEVGSGEVYLANVSSVGAFTASGAPIQRIPLPGGSPEGAGIAVNATTETLYVADSAADTIDVLGAEPPAKPTVSALSAQNITPSSAQLSAQVDPRGSDTHYYFQYGTVNCASSPASCADGPAPPGTDIGAGFSDQSASVELSALKPSTTYYYRLIASNGEGQAEGEETFGSITTLPSASGLLPDGRAWELVSPPEKDGSSIEPLRKEGGLIQASEDGNSITYIANGPIEAEPQGTRGPYPTQILAKRSSAGWSSKQIVTPRTKGEGFIPGEAPEYRMFSADLSSGLVEPDNHHPGEPLEQPPLAPEATEKTIYLRNSESGSYLPLVTPADVAPGTKFGEDLEFIDATPDLSHVVFSSKEGLTAGAGPGLYEWQAGRPLEALSVLPDGSPALEPALGAESHNVRGAVSSNGTRVIWTGESEVLHGSETETVRHLYMRETTTGQTLQLDATTAGIAEPGEEESEVGFQAASSEGSKVFFTDTARLTGDSKLEPMPGLPGNPADLYECEVTEEGGKLACDLRDLTADQNLLESADVLNVAPALSEDGSYVYFVANGVLAPGASPGDCVHSDQEAPPPGATCSLYVWHEGSTSFIAKLSDEDSGDWGSTEGAGPRGFSVEPRPDLASVTASSSPDGEFFAFMSDRSLTGYDNVDANPAAKGAHDEEVYLYDAATKLIVCASCNPGGQAPHGVLDTGKAGEGLGLVVDRAQNWASSSPEPQAPTAHWLAGSIPGWSPLGNESAAQALRAPRYLSNSGRLFFNSADALVHVEGAHTRQETVGGEPTQVGVESVYQYEPSGIGSCTKQEGCVALISSGTSEQESAFVDASVGGEDAFFVTSQPLVARDRDTNYD
ncbi:MAG TPA: hypothetical protein VKG38_04300, partial [Solirubrobacteraceae bacterium]|nr:hypothetical protein [Solirubrobacteraceae bacterium]